MIENDFEDFPVVECPGNSEIPKNWFLLSKKQVQGIEIHNEKKAYKAFSKNEFTHTVVNKKMRYMHRE
jgi:hypothetical protein